jgi:small subunit ribosomal protein S2
MSSITSRSIGAYGLLQRFKMVAKSSFADGILTRSCSSVYQSATSGIVEAFVPERKAQSLSPVNEMFSSKTLLDARVHLGHRARLWNPKMAPYVLGSRNGMHIINLDQTVVMLRRALNAVSLMAENGCTFLWLGPGDPQKHRLVSKVAERAGSYSIEGRWIGGTLTNMIASGQAHKFDYRIPDCVFVIDMLRHAPALNEARNVGIPVVGIADTDCNPDLLTYPIPGNDDGVYAINIYCNLMRLAILDGRRRASMQTRRPPVSAWPSASRKRERRPREKR